MVRLFILLFSIPLLLYGENLLLKVEMIGDYPLYPGQRAKIVYTIYYKGEIKLTKEELPLLDPKGFRKVGSLSTKEGSKGEYSLNEITQEIEAINPGTFVFPPSVLEGQLTTYKPGDPKPVMAKVEAQYPSLKLEVHPFPEEGKPSSFNGALGEYSVAVKMLNLPKIQLGDELQLKITITGKGQMDTVSIPNVFCQPGFSGFFTHIQVPVEEKPDTNSKIYLLKLRAQSENIWQVPSITFSSFDPTSKSYHLSKTEPIPLTVLARNEGREEVIEQALPFATSTPILPNIPLENEKEAYQNYQLAEKSSEIRRRRELFNQALSEYQKAEVQDGQLLYNIANGYFQLGEYPLAILYYERALTLSPRNFSAKKNLELARRELHLKPERQGFADYLAFMTKRESLQLLLLFSFLSMLTGTVYLWHRQLWTRRIFLFFVAFTVITLFHQAYVRYFTPLYGILLHPSLLYQNQEANSSYVLKNPIIPGTKLIVMDVVQDGTWIKVLTPDQKVGYLPSQDIGIK